ncbi:MAG: type II secretion system F family protein [Thermacetogeniaceae bacterium]
MLLERAYLALTALSCAAAVFLALECAASLISNKVNARRMRRNLLESLPEVLRRGDSRHLGQFDRRFSRAGLRREPFLAVTAGLAVSGATLGFVLLRDLGISLVLAAGSVFISLLALDWAVERRERKLMDQMPIAIQLFSVEYDTTKSIEEAMARAAKGVGEPLRSYMEQCARDLKSGKSSKTALEDFAENVGNSYGRLWSRMLLAASSDMTVTKVMPRLIERLSKQKLLQQKNMTELSGTRRIAWIVNALVVPCFVLVQVFFPKSSEFFGQPLGRLVVALYLVSLSVGIMLDRLLQRVDF